MTTSQDTAPAGDGRRRLFIGAWLIILSLFFVTVATMDLANYRPLSGDDGWILSASYKLATDGVFGSDMYAGFFDADRHYFIALPGQHVLQALSMYLFGPGISQARWVSVLSGLALLWAASLAAWRWYGPAVAIVTGIFLLFWQPALAGEGGVPLVTLSRSLRYDLPAVAWIWLTILAFDGWLRRPTPVRSLLTGVASAAATLTQFFGSVTLIIVPLGVLAHYGKRRPTRANVGSWLLGFLSLAGPYALYVARHWQDALGQTAYLKRERASLGIQSLLGNLMREPLRYRPILEQLDIAPGPWVLALGVWPALAYLGLRLWRDGRRGDRMLALTLAATLLFLSLVDRTKAPIYALPLVPPLCMAFALLATRMVSWVVGSVPWERRVAGAAAVLLLALTVLHGFHFYYRDWRAASSVSDYQALGRAIDAELEPGTAVAGSERWWWPLREHDYLAVRNLAVQWKIEAEQRDDGASFAALSQAYGIRYILVDVIVHTDIGIDSPLLQEQFDAFLERCATEEGQWADSTYGEISLYEVKAECRGST